MTCVTNMNNDNEEGLHFESVTITGGNFRPKAQELTRVYPETLPYYSTIVGHFYGDLISLSTVTFMAFKAFLCQNILINISIYRIDHGFEINIQGLAEDIYREIHGLSHLDNTTLT